MGIDIFLACQAVVTAKPFPPAMQTLAYGPAPSQIGDLYLPANARPAVVVLLHGGFWRAPYGRDELAPIATDLVARGYAVWNLEYRRVGEPGGGWPGTLSDVAEGIDHLAALVDQGVALDLSRIVVAGHSAGGHLALWAAAKNRPSSSVIGPRRVRLRGAAGLAPVADLAQAHALHCGRDAVATFLGGTPQSHPDRYAAADPRQLLPLGTSQLLLHGTADDVLPVTLTSDYAATACAAGDAVEFVALEGADHFTFTDPASDAHQRLCRWIAALVG